MTRLLSAAAALALALGIIGGASAAPLASGTISLGTAAPQVGADLVLIGTYSHVPQSRQPQFPNQPQAQLNCDSGWGGVQGTVAKKSIGGGVTQGTYDFGIVPAGTSFCNANYGYFYEDQAGVHYFQLGFVTFEVSP